MCWVWQRGDSLDLAGGNEASVPQSGLSRQPADELYPLHHLRRHGLRGRLAALRRAGSKKRVREAVTKGVAAAAVPGERMPLFEDA